MVKITKIPGLGDYGVYVDGVDLQNISIPEWKSVYGKLHLESLVTIFRGTKIEPLKFHALVSSFGRSNGMSPYSFFKKYGQTIDRSLPVYTAWDAAWKKFASGEINISEEDKQFLRDVHNLQIQNLPPTLHRVTGLRNEEGHRIGIFAEGDLSWHCNESGHLSFTPGVALMTIQSVGGSSTGFCISAPWYERQTEAFKSELDELVCIHQHTPGKLTPGATSREDYTTKYNFCPEDNYIPLVIKSPIGIKGLHFSYSTVTGFQNMKQSESDRLLAKINNELLAEDNTYDHWYDDSRQDVLFFENSITQHRRLGDVRNRLLYRCTTSYCDLLEYQYQPYFQEEFKQKIREQVADVAETLAIPFKKFKE